MRKEIWAGCVCFFFASLTFVGICSAADPGKQPKEQPQKEAILKELGVLSGYAWGPLKKKDDYELILTIIRFGFNLNPLLKKICPGTKGLAEFEVEPFANTVISPDSNAEVGCNLLLKYAFPLTERFLPYIEGGAGVVYMTQHTREQSTQFNFVPQIGIGMTYFIKKGKLALNVGYRYRHLSNCSIKSPNSGINVDSVLVGLSLVY